MNIAVFLLEDRPQTPVAATEDEAIGNTWGSVRLPPLGSIEDGRHKARQYAAQREEAPERCDEFIKHGCPKTKEVHGSILSC